MSKKVASEKVSIAGDSGVTTEDTNMEDALYTCQFCGYYPSDAPQYSIIVTLNRKGIPASAAMPCEVAKEIIEATL